MNASERDKSKGGRARRWHGPWRGESRKKTYVCKTRMQLEHNLKNFVRVNMRFLATLYSYWWWSELKPVRPQRWRRERRGWRARKSEREEEELASERGARGRRRKPVFTAHKKARHKSTGFITRPPSLPRNSARDKRDSLQCQRIRAIDDPPLSVYFSSIQQVKPAHPQCSCRLSASDTKSRTRGGRRGDLLPSDTGSTAAYVSSSRAEVSFLLKM